MLVKETPLSWRELLEIALRPAAVDRDAGTTQCADAADDEAAGGIGTEAAEHGAGVPGPLPFGQDGAPDIVAERLR